MGRCGAVCAFGLDDAPPIEHASWGNCTPGGTLTIGQQCEFLCDEGFVSYVRAGEPGRPKAVCSGFGRTTELRAEGQCTNPQCIDNGLWATQFPSAAGNLTSPLVCNAGDDASACRHRHSRQLMVDTQEAEALEVAMFSSNSLLQPGSAPNAPVETRGHVLLYNIESTQLMHTMFGDGYLESRPALEVLGSLPAPGTRVGSAQSNGTDVVLPHSAECDSMQEVAQYFGYVRVICCEQDGEECPDFFGLPTTCRHPACSNAVDRLQRHCMPYLSTDTSTYFRADVEAAVTVCHDVVPPGSAPPPNIIVLSNASAQRFSGCEGTIINPDDDNPLDNVRRTFEVSIRAQPGFGLQFTFNEFAVDDTSSLSIFDNQNLVGEFHGAAIPRHATAQSGKALVVFQTSGGAATFRLEFSCVCEDLSDWASNERGCTQYSSSGATTHGYCAVDTGHRANGQTMSALDGCPASCGRCSDDYLPQGRRILQRVGHAADLQSDGGATALLLGSSSGSHVPMRIVAGHALQSEVVVHAPTLAAAEGAMCRAVARGTNSSCCLADADCDRYGRPRQCHVLCALAAAAPPPAPCMTLGWFASWRDELAQLCANVSTTVSIGPPPLVVGMCTSGAPITHACGRTVAFEAAAQPHQSCSSVISAPAHYFVRATVLRTTIEMEHGESVRMFDGLVAEWRELANFDGFALHYGPSPTSIDPPCATDLTGIASTMDSICCAPPSVCVDGVPTDCSSMCAEVFLPFYSECADFVGSALPRLVPFAAQCAASSLSSHVDSSGQDLRVEFVPSSSATTTIVAPASSTFSLHVECVRIDGGH